MPDISVHTPADEREVAEFAAVDAEAFADSQADAEKWFSLAGDGLLLRVARVGGVMAGGYGLYPSRQLIGGRPVRADCVITAAVEPRFRRRGVAAALLRDLVEQASARGAALAPLTASTTRLYRRWGWEVGGRHINQRVRTDALARFRGEGETVDEPDLDAVAALRLAHYAPWDGPLDRPPGWIDQMAEERTPQTVDRHRRIGWLEDGRLTGYLRYEASRGEGAHWVVVRVHEFVATTRDALDGLLGFLGGYEAQTPDVTFAHNVLPVQAPLLQLIPDADKRIQLEGRICWMQRIVDVPRAMADRGWRGADCQVALTIDDPCRDEPLAGVLEVRSGAGRWVDGARPDGVRCGLGVLSAWYMGTLTAVDATRYGLMEGTAEDLEALDGALGVTRPWMPDFF